VQTYLRVPFRHVIANDSSGCFAHAFSLGVDRYWFYSVGRLIQFQPYDCIHIAAVGGLH
jgi:hypothetical protein